MTALTRVEGQRAWEPAAAGAWSRGAWAIYLGMVVVTLDGSALNLALPHLGAEFDATTSGLEWVVNAYTLPLATLLMLAGSLGDRLGARRLFILSAAGFGAASLACALSPNLQALTAFRGLQGVCGAGLLPMVLALTIKTISDPAQRRKAVNLVAVFGGGAIAAGPLLGGLVTDTLGWRVVFWLTLVPLAVAIYLIRPTPETARTTSMRVDVAGQIIGTVALTALVTAMVEASTLGWTSTRTLALVAAGLGGALLFAAVERGVSSPMIPPGTFSNPTFVAASVGGFAFQFSVYGLQFLLAVYVQRQWGYSPLHAGLLLLTFSVGVLTATLGLNPLLMHRGPRAMLLIGTPLAVAGAAVAVVTGGPHTSGWLAAGNLLIGVGAGIYSPSLNQVAATSAGSSRSGLASGIYNTARQFGQATGVALLGALAAMPDAASGLHLGIALCGLLGALIFILSAAFVPHQAR